MPHWLPLHAAILQHDPNARRLGLIREIETWLDRPWEAALEACTRAAPTIERARELNALLNLVVGALRRDLAIVDGPAGAARLQELTDGYQAGTLAMAVRRPWERFNIAFGLWYTQRQQDPAVAEVAVHSPQETAARAALDALIERQKDTQQYAVPGGATPQRMEALEEVVGDYRREIAAAEPGSPLHVDLCFYAAHAAYALARGWRILGRVERAAPLYAEAAILYGQGDRPDDARQAADEARKLGHAADGDLGAASRQDLRDLIEREAEPLTRARAQARLCALATAANDAFDACEWAEKAVASLVQAGFADPQTEAREALCDGWVQAACRTVPPPAPLALLLQVGNLYQDLLGARHTRWVDADPARAQRSATALAALNAMLLEIAAQPAAARQLVVEGLARYTPALNPHAADPPPSDDLAARRDDIAARLEAIKREANDADAVRDAAALQALVPRAAACVSDARATLLGPTIGLACQTEAYVRLRAGDAPGAARSAEQGEARVLDGLAATPHTLAGHPQFGLLLELRRVRVEALAAQGDDAGLLALAEESVRLIEARRYQVADPYQQGAFLASRTLFYEMAVFANFRLKRWDGLLAAMELIKARAALLGRMTASSDAAQGALVARLDAANAVLATAPAGSDARLAAAEQRRLLLSLLAVERRSAATAASASTPSVATLQAALAPDEAIVAWVWVATGVAVVLALTAADLRAERVVLAPQDRALLDDHVALVRGGGVTVRAFDAMVTRLASVLLPPATRAFIGAARRLILSPHRALHLLPFHAAVFDGRFLIEQAAIRYVPNLSSLLLPSRALSPAPARMLAVGIDEFAVPGQDWAALATAEDEARTVARAWRDRGAQPDVLLGPQATVATLRALQVDLPAYRCLHLATHASSVFDATAADDPFAARLILQDGAIDALSISQWRLAAEVVVLSACDSGQRALGGRGLAELPGDDLFGLQAALFEAGAQSVVGALWPVDDRVAPGIVAVLHAGLAAGLAPDLALCEAMRRYLAQPEARRRIYFWAPLFVTSLGRAGPAPGQEAHRA